MCFFPLHLASITPYLAGPLKIWGISCCLTLINGPHLYQLKQRGGGVAAQIQTRWLWNFTFWIVDKAPEVTKAELYQGKVIMDYINSCIKGFLHIYLDVKGLRKKSKLQIIYKCFYCCWIKKNKTPSSKQHFICVSSVVRQYGKIWHACVWKLTGWMLRVCVLGIWEMPGHREP